MRIDKIFTARRKKTEKDGYNNFSYFSPLLMNTHEVLDFVDEVIYTKTGKHLNDLQRGIIEGTLKRQKYADIASTYSCSAGHAKDVGYELLQMLSNIFDEPVDKKHLKSILERQGNLNISLGDRSIACINNNHIIGNINVGSEQPNPTVHKSDREDPDFQQKKNNQIQQEKIDKLRQYGLNDQQIAEILELPLEVVKKVDLEE